MIFCGIPIFFQEVALGQYLGAGGMTFIGELVPIMKGKSLIKILFQLIKHFVSRENHVPGFSDWLIKSDQS